jgi:molybdopterin synthase catalytic subunit
VTERSAPADVQETPAKQDGPAPGQIAVRARLFARQRELAGTREVALQLPGGASIEDAWAAIAELYPVLADGRPWLRFARNGEYADPATPLADGDEVACIPPVSGGADREVAEDPGPGARILELREAPFGKSILAELADRLALPWDGAVVGFLGITRETPGTPAPGEEAEAARHRGRQVQSLDYEAHESMALSALGRIVDEMTERFGVTRVAIVHRTGTVPLGEPSIAIVVCSPHRGPAFEAARYAIEETKARVPIWKAERFLDGHVWIGEPARDGPRPATRD